MLQLESEGHLEAEFLLSQGICLFLKVFQVIGGGPPTLWKIIFFTQCLLIHMLIIPRKYLQSSIETDVD